MKIPARSHLLAGLLITLTLAAHSVAPAAVITLENFTGVANGAPLVSVPNWGLQAGTTDTAAVQSAAGYNGPGANISTQSLYRYAIPAANQATVGSLLTGYSIKLQLSSTNNYQQAQVLLGKNDGVNGLAIVFDGGTNDTDADNSIKLSSGGTNWGSITYNTLANTQWQSNAWYQIDFTNISLVSTGFGSAVTGYVTITNLNTQIQLVSNQVVTGLGNSGTFNTIDSVVVGNKGSSRQINFDDITATTVPEPGIVSLALLALAGIVPLLCRRHRAA